MQKASQRRTRAVGRHDERMFRRSDVKRGVGGGILPFVLRMSYGVEREGNGSRGRVAEAEGPRLAH